MNNLPQFVVMAMLASYSYASEVPGLGIFIDEDNLERLGGLVKAKQIYHDRVYISLELSKFDQCEIDSVYYVVKRGEEDISASYLAKHPTRKTYSISLNKNFLDTSYLSLNCANPQDKGVSSYFFGLSKISIELK